MSTNRIETALGLPTGLTWNQFSRNLGESAESVRTPFAERAGRNQLLSASEARTWLADIALGGYQPDTPHLLPPRYGRRPAGVPDDALVVAPTRPEAVTPGIDASAMATALGLPAQITWEAFQERFGIAAGTVKDEFLARAGANGTLEANEVIEWLTDFAFAEFQLETREPVRSLAVTTPGQVGVVNVPVDERATTKRLLSPKAANMLAQRWAGLWHAAPSIEEFRRYASPFVFAQLGEQLETGTDAHVAWSSTFQELVRAMEHWSVRVVDQTYDYRPNLAEVEILVDAIGREEQRASDAPTHRRWTETRIRALLLPKPDPFSSPGYEEASRLAKTLGDEDLCDLVRQKTHTRDVVHIRAAAPLDRDSSFRNADAVVAELKASVRDQVLAWSPEQRAFHVTLWQDQPPRPVFHTHDNDFFGHHEYENDEIIAWDNPPGSSRNRGTYLESRRTDFARLQLPNSIETNEQVCATIERFIDADYAKWKAWVRREEGMMRLESFSAQLLGSTDRFLDPSHTDPTEWYSMWSGEYGPGY